MMYRNIILNAEGHKKAKIHDNFLEDKVNVVNNTGA